MVVVKGLLKTWYESNNKVLLFCQTRQMMEILEIFLQQKGYTYRKMDGDTPIKTRVFLVDEFNSNKDIFIFLLTTKVGGLGINLCSANRVIIFDPDWNPSTDMQARERAWRLGQKRDVAIFRIMAKGTVEEKIYHRQIYKQFLTNKILIDPNHQRFFKQDDLMDLFSFNDDDNNVNNTKSITGKILKNMDMDVEINKDDIAKMEKDISKKEKEEKNKENEWENENNNKVNSKQQQPFSINYDDNEKNNNNDDRNDLSNSEISIPSTTTTSNEISTKKVKKKKKLSLNSVDNNVKQTKYGQEKYNPFTDYEHNQQIIKEMNNIEGIAYTEEFKMKSNKNEEDESFEDEKEEVNEYEVDENDLFTQSEDEDENINNDHNKRKGKGKSKEKEKSKMNDNNMDEDDDDENIEFEKVDVNKANEYQSKDELRILKNLMKITGAVSVIEHDKIMDSKKWSDIRDDKEAERIANNAVKKLRQFMERRRHVDISIPTWTGR